jgi:hypothetical protein
MFNQELPTGFLAIHPPRRLWPSVPAFDHEGLPIVVQPAQTQQRPTTMSAPRPVPHAD